MRGQFGTTGTYRISGAQQHIASEAMTGLATAPVVTFDSVSCAFLTAKLSQTAMTALFTPGNLQDQFWRAIR